MDSMLRIGADRLAVEAVVKGSLAILATSAGDTVKIKALDVLQHSAEVKDIQVANCTFTNAK